MASGTLENVSNSAFVRTPPMIVAQIAHNLLVFPAEPTTILDPTAGEGDLLAPFAELPGAFVAGVELSEDRAAVARRTLPQAQIITSAFEHVRVQGRFSLVIANPPYFFQDGRRAEYTIIRDAGALLVPGGIMVAVIPARSAWDGTMVSHWVKHYTTIQVWKFPDLPDHEEAAFSHYRQIVVAGVRRATPLATIDEAEKGRLRGFRYRTKLDKPGDSPWAGGSPPPVVPTAPLADRYAVPAVPERPTFTIVKADDSALLRGLDTGGVHLGADWKAATTLFTDAEVQQAVMPSTGVAHQAADVLTGLLDGDILADRYVLSTFVTSEWVTVEIDEERRKKEPNLVGVRQQQDRPVLGVLDLHTADVQYYEGEDAFGFLTPMLPLLADQVLAKRCPLYHLDPADWELEIVARIGLDKQLPGAAHPGLAEPQMHRVFALHRAVQSRKTVAIQGEPGTGKTRMLTALTALMAHAWNERAGQFHGQKQPGWAKRLRNAWKANPRVPGAAPNALPVLVVTPMRVVPTWEKEISAAYPAAETVVIADHRDVKHWLDRCAVSEAPVVVGILSQSKTRAFGRAWQPAVIERQHEAMVPITDMTDLPDDLTPNEVDVIGTDTEVLGIVSKADQQILCKPVTIRNFFCPDCGTRITALPRGVKGNTDASTGATEDEGDGDGVVDDLREPVTSRTWFSRNRRTCTCGAPLWTDARIPATQRKHPQISFADWSTGAAALAAGTAPAPQSRQAHCIIDAAGTLGPQAKDSFSPFEYLYRNYRGCVALSIIDESHNARGANTDIARSVHQAGLAAQATVYASGTHYGGMLSDLFYYWFRFDPAFWKRLGFGWNDVEQAMRHYGVVQQVTKEYEADARKGTGQTDIRVTTVPAPGISAKLLPHLLSTMAFIGIMDVGAHMPEKVEIPVVVPQGDPALLDAVATAKTARDQAATTVAAAHQAVQEATDDPGYTHAERAERIAAETEARAALDEAERVLRDRQETARRFDLESTYGGIEAVLEQKAQEGNNAAMLAKGTLPRWWCILPCVEPAFEVWGTKRDQWGDEQERSRVFAAPVMPADHLYPLEQQLIATVTAERQEGRRVMVFFEQNDIRSTAKRLAWVLAEFNPWILPNKVDAEDREDAIKAAVAAGHDVVIVPYRRVSEGLNLQLLDSTIWYEMPLNLFHLDQASRRTWRLGATNQKRMYYFAYEGTVAYSKLRKLGSQSGAASLFAGDTPDGELARHAGADKTTLARMSAGLEHGRAGEDADVVADLAAVFRRRSEELATALKAGRQWVGVTDTLPDRLARVRARLAGKPAALPAHLKAPASSPASSPQPAAPGRAAVVAFGNDADIATTLRKQRQSRRTRQRTTMREATQNSLLALFGTEGGTLTQTSLWGD